MELRIQSGILPQLRFFLGDEFLQVFDAFPTAWMRAQKGNVETAGQFQQFFVQAYRAFGVEAVRRHVIKTDRIGFALMVAAVRGFDEIRAQSDGITSAGNARKSQTGANERADSLNRTRA